MIVCKTCKSPAVQVIASDPFGDEVELRCLTCQEIFTLTKFEVQDNECNDD